MALVEGVPEEDILKIRQEKGVYIWICLQVEGWMIIGLNRRTGTGTLWKAWRADETGAGNHGTVKGRKSDGMGSENEQYTIVCKGDCG